MKSESTEAQALDTGAPPTADVRGFYGALGVKLPAYGGPDVTVACFANPYGHSNDDAKPSCSVNVVSGLWKCHGCEKAGNTYQAALACGRTPVAADGLLAEHGLSRASGEGEAIYDYLDEHDSLLYQVLRRKGKQFSQRRPATDGSGTWQWTVSGVRRVPYRLPELLAAVARGEVVYVVEGEKDADRLVREGAWATCNSGGAGKWHPEFASLFAGTTVVVIADKDKKGKQHAFEVADSLRAAAVSVETVQARAGNDVSDHLDAGHTLEELEPLPDEPSDSTPRAPLEAGDDDPSPDDRDGPGDDDGASPQAASASSESAAARLLDLVRESRIELFHDPHDRGYATVNRNGHAETHFLDAEPFKLHLRYLHYQEFRSGVAGQALADALGTLQGQALFDGTEREVALRLAEHAGNVYLDLGDPAWTAVEITRNGWRMIPEPPVRFRRSTGMSALPRPEAGGGLEELRRLINYGSDENWQLIVGWLLGALRPTGPYPLLALHGEQGSSKSTLARMLRELIDPSQAPLRSLPSGERDLVIEANASWMLCFDNASGLKAWLSDALCRIATGGGYATRQLYTDQDQVIFDLQRPIVINGIEELVTRSDLLDRALLIQLPRIDASERRTEADLWREFEAAKPRILGALLDTVASALGNLETVSIDDLPRMADFALWVTAAEPALGWKPRTFMQAYAANRTAADQIALEASAIGRCLMHAAETGFDGTATRLLENLNSIATDEERKLFGWPKMPQKLSGQVNRLAPNLRALGYEVDTERTNQGSRIRLSKPTQPSSHPSHASPRDPK